MFNEVGSGAYTSVAGTASVSVDGDGPASTGGALSRNVTSTTLGVYASGYYEGSASAPYGSFRTLSLSGGSLTLQAGGGAFASVIATDQNELRFSFTAVAAPVPEPEVWALLLAGTGLVGWATRRRRRIAA